MEENQNIEVEVQEVQEPVNEEVTDAVEATETAEAAAEVKEEPKEEEHGGFQKRIDRFNRRISEKEAEIEYWKKAALERQPQQAQAQPQVVQDGRPDINQFESITDYTEALTDWKVQQAIAQRETQQAKKSLIQSYQSRVNEFIKEHPDFDEVLQDSAHVQAAPEIHSVVAESEVGPALAYYLAQNLDEVKRLNALAPHRRLIELGKLEDRISSPAKTAPAKKISNAPAPVKIEKGAAPSKRDLSDPSLSQAEYRAIRMKQLSNRR